VTTIAELRGRSEDLFSQLLAAQTTRSGGRRPAAAARRTPEQFSWFDPEHAIKAAALSFRLSALAASRKRVNDALGSALDHVEEEARRADPEQVRQGFALFVTHNHEGRRLAKPRTVAAAPGLFNPPGRGTGTRRPSISIGGLSPGLDYWREDALANEHHQHWHEVYPYTGLPPRRFADWLAQTSQGELVAILTAMVPENPNWASTVSSSSSTQLAQLFAQAVQSDRVNRLPRDLYSKLFHLNDRQGELFFYMHQQMLARYDAELLSAGLDRVEPFGPEAWGKPIAAGHDPIGVPGFSRREPDRMLPAEAASQLDALSQEIDVALRSKRLRDAQGGTVPIDRTNIGEAVEATVGQLHELDPAAYPGLHNAGHGHIARLSRPPDRGVMRSTVTAIRDPVFWQWHKFIDELNATWQKTLAPYEFDDAPNVLLRNGLEADGEAAWASPDIILCRTSDLPPRTDPSNHGEKLFGGANWSSDFSEAQATAGSTTLQTTGGLITNMATVNFGGKAVRYLTHEPFSYFIRIENKAAGPLDVTVRILLAPADQASDRRAWMEMDKFPVTVPGRSKTVVYRPDTESSIVKRPSETGPESVLAGGGDPDENSYCDCGWPYTLLLPRGTAAGMPCRLLVMCSDARIDRIDAPEHCGSMSYCGAVDRYPDARDMGYPFCRPFAGRKATAIRDRFVALPSAAARTVTIRHV
jgi:hypothetical protein